MGDIKALALTTEDWNSVYNIPDSVAMVCNEDLEVMSKTLYDITFINRIPTAKEMGILLKKCTKAYTVFVTDNVEITEKLKKIIECRKAQIIKESALQDFFDKDIRNFFSSPYGEKKFLQNIAISHNFKGSVRWNGGNTIDLEGDFGDVFGQIAYWKYNIVIFRGQCLDMFLEYEKDDDVHVQLSLSNFVEGSRDVVQQRWVIDEDELGDTFKIDNELKNGFIFASVRAKGKGKLRIAGLHTRVSRRGYGDFLPGGKIFRTSKGEEVFAYFDPGDMKPPLNVYFSGYKTQEGFEGYFMMKNMQSPFLLIGEPRLEGGCFYIGEDEYEKLIVDVLKKYIDELGFSRGDVILSGLSMGTTGALYYSADIMPHAVIIGKPLLNLGNVAANETRFRPGGFPTSVDVLLKTIGKTDLEAINQLNDKIWSKVKNADYSETKFIVSYMIEDDYDMEAYKKLIEGLSSTGVHIYGKGLHGRHNDDTHGIIYWFSSRYKSVIREDFRREIE